MLALGRVLGRVVAGRFWCSYAWVSLTLATRVRPRAPVLDRVRVRAPVIERACRRARFLYARARVRFPLRVRVRVPLGGGGGGLSVVGGCWLIPFFRWRWCWRWWALAGGRVVGAYLFLFCVVFCGSSLSLAFR